MRRDRLVQAIVNKKCLILIDSDGDVRNVQPHVIYNPKGEDILVCYQTIGYSGSDRAAGWKQIKLAKIMRLITSTDPFQPRADFNPSRYRNVEVQV